MLKFYPLFSGSSGNMYLVESNNTKIVIDVGVSYKAIKYALDSINISPQDIDAIFITHEHIDHTRGIGRFLKFNSIPLYMTKPTLDALYDKHFSQLDTAPEFHEVKYNSNIIIKDITISPFKVSHDAAMPVGYEIICGDKSIAIATDLGYIDEPIYSHLKSSNLSVIEANYDTNLLMYGPYPFSTKKRIQGEFGHLSNTDTSAAILNLAKDGKRNFILGHISMNNNSNDQALYEVINALEKNGFDLKDFNINIATRDFSNEVYML